MTATDRVAEFLEDAAHYPGGHATGVVFPRDEAQLARALREAVAVLPVGAQSSLTGGATPRGEVVLSLSQLTAITDLGLTHVTAQPGVTLTRLRERLTDAGQAYPPVPTFEGATLGGVVSTNAAGATTFKYGITLVAIGISIQQLQVKAPRRLSLVCAAKDHIGLLAKRIITIVFAILRMGGAGINSGPLGVVERLGPIRPEYAAKGAGRRLHVFRKDDAALTGVIHSNGNTNAQAKRQCRVRIQRDAPG